MKDKKSTLLKSSIKEISNNFPEKKIVLTQGFLTSLRKMGVSKKAIENDVRALNDKQKKAVEIERDTRSKEEKLLQEAKELIMWKLEAIADFFKEIYRKIKYFIQRGQRGYSDSDLWDAHSHISVLIARMMEDLSKKHSGHPMGLTNKKWEKILKDIAGGFMASEELSDLTNMLSNRKREEARRKRLNKKFDKAIDLFREYFLNLWD